MKGERDEGQALTRLMFRQGVAEKVETLKAQVLGLKAQLEGVDRAIEIMGQSDDRG